MKSHVAGVHSDLPEMAEEHRWIDAECVARSENGWRLVGSECVTCGVRFFPRTDICSTCLSRDLRRMPFSPRGRIYSVTTVAKGLPGFATPYQVAWVDFREGVRVFGRILPGDGEEPKIGVDVEVTVMCLKHDPDGVPVLGYGFRARSGNDG